MGKIRRRWKTILGLEKGFLVNVRTAFDSACFIATSMARFYAEDNICDNSQCKPLYTHTASSNLSHISLTVPFCSDVVFPS